MRTPEKLEEIRALSPSRKTNELVQSKYFPTSHPVQENPEALHSSEIFLRRNYIVLDQKVTYGKPLTP